MTRPDSRTDIHDTLRIGDRGVLIDGIIHQLSDAAGPGRILAVGRNSNMLLRPLLAAGFDAFVLDEQLSDGAYAGGVVPPDRLRRGSMVSVPFPDGDFDTVIWTDVTAYDDPAMLSPALRELSRVTRRSAFLRISAHLERERWESLLFEAGFRKHAKSFRVNSYHLLEHPSPPITVVVEKTPRLGSATCSRHTGNVGQNPVHDMLRASGRESDARLARYHQLHDYVRPGDAILDLRCGCGDGLHVLRHNSAAKGFLGIDDDAIVIEYAGINFGDEKGNIKFRSGNARSVIEVMPASSADVVIVFDLSNDDAAILLLAQCKRILKPGGRLIASATRAVDPPASDAAAFSFMQLKNLLLHDFLLEDLYVQNAEQSGGGRWLRQIGWEDCPVASGQWWIATAIRDPLSEVTGVPYHETVFSNLAAVKPVSTDYTTWYINPWILHSMVHVGYRVKSPALLENLARRLLAISPDNSADHGAALCILIYRMMNAPACEGDLPALVDRIQAYLRVESSNPHVLRWQISLMSALGRLYQQLGKFPEAMKFYRTCAGMNASRFSIHLETKVADAFFWWGWLALNQGDPREAQSAWEGGIGLGNRLLHRPINDVVMNPAYPNAFDHGDGMREFVLALESVTQCANGINALRRHEEGRRVDWAAVHNTFGSGRNLAARELRAAQWKLDTVSTQLDETRNHLRARTGEVVAAREDLLARTSELDIVRDQVATARADLIGELESNRAELIDRTAQLDLARDELISRTASLDETRAELVARTGHLDTARNELISRTADLDETRAELVDRTRQLDEARGELVRRTMELNADREQLIARTAQLEATRAELTQLNAEVNWSGLRPLIRAIAALRRRWNSGRI